jgi:hypothetical protein
MINIGCWRCWRVWPLGTSKLGYDMIWLENQESHRFSRFGVDRNTTRILLILGRTAMEFQGIPSGNHTKNNGTSLFFMGKFTIIKWWFSIVISRSLPEGNCHKCHLNHDPSWAQAPRWTRSEATMDTSLVVMGRDASWHLTIEMGSYECLMNTEKHGEM